MGRIGLRCSLIYLLAAILLDRPTMVVWALRAGWSVLLVVLIWAALPRRHALWRAIGAVVAVATGLAAVRLAHPWLWLALVAASGMADELPGRSARAACAAVPAAIGLYALATELFGLECLITEPVARWLSSFATFAAGRPVSGGPTYLALDFAIAYIVSCAAISLFAASHGRRRGVTGLRNLVIAVGGGLLLYLALIALFARFTGLSGSWFMALAGCAALLFAALAGAFAWLSTLWERAEHDAPLPRPQSSPSSSRRRRRVELAIGIISAALIAALGIGAAEYGEVRESVMFLSEQSGMFIPTSPSDFSDKSRPSFYWLPAYLEGTGYDVSWGGFTSSDLEQTQVVVAINVVSELSEDSRAALSAFIEGGGSLLVLADHTLYPSGTHPLDFVMSPSGIALNFDTARSLFAAGWGQPGLEFGRHPVTAGITDEARTQLGTGASLRVSPPARKIIAAKAGGFIDAPDMSRPDKGYLGDLAFNVGERMGDIPLVAAGHLGQGKLLVFGDTSSFQNPSLAMSSRFIDQIFHWLARQRRLPVASWVIVLAAAALCVAVGAIVAPASLVVPRSLAALVGALLACVLALEVPMWVQPAPKRPFIGGTAIVDRSHYPAFSSDFWGEAGLGGLYHNILRSQLLPIQMERFDAEAIARAETVFIIGSQSPYSTSEVSVLQRFVESGGRLVVSAGWEERRGVEGLLARFGMSIEPVALGRFTVHAGTRPVQMPKAWPIAVKDPNASICLTMWDKPVVVTRAIGQGRITVIGDSMFLFNPNIETVGSYNIGNIEFLRAHAFSTSAH